MDYESKISLIVFLAFLLGIVIGWFATSFHYETEKAKCDAVKKYKQTERLKRPPKSYTERQNELLTELAGYSEHYTVKDGNQTWTYNKEQEQ